MRAGVIELFAFEVELRTTEVLGQALGKIQRTRAADEITLEVRQLFVKLRVNLGFFVFCRQIVNQWHQGFGDVLPAKVAEQAFGIRAIAK